MLCPGTGQRPPRRHSYRKWLGGGVVRKDFLEEVKSVLSPCKRRNRKMDLGEVEKEGLWRGNSTCKSTKAWNNVTSLESTQQFVWLSVGFLWERGGRELRVLGQGREGEVPVSECLLGDTIWVTFVRHLQAWYEYVLVYSNMDTEGQWRKEQTELRFETELWSYPYDLGQLPSPLSARLPSVSSGND